MNWQFIERINEYRFWYYDDTDGKRVYNCTQTDTPPQTIGGYYSYAYILAVKGVKEGDTLTSIFASIR